MGRRNVIAEVSRAWNGVTIIVRRVCTVREDKAAKFKVGVPMDEIGGSAHNELIISAYYPEDKKDRELIRMATGTDCSPEHLDSYLRLTLRELDRKLDGKQKRESLPFHGPERFESIDALAERLLSCAYYKPAMSIPANSI